ncbi:MAG: hypothetical protein AB1629_04965 [Candidatus Omnitrophota bacterium]
MIKTKRALLALESILVLAVILIGLIAMSVIVRQRISGRYRIAADAIGAGRQYEPYGGHKTVIDAQDLREELPPETPPPCDCYAKCFGRVPCDWEDSCFGGPVPRCFAICKPREEEMKKCQADCEARPAAYGCET